MKIQFPSIPTQQAPRFTGHLDDLDNSRNRLPGSPIQFGKTSRRRRPLAIIGTALAGLALATTAANAQTSSSQHNVSVQNMTGLSDSELKKLVSPACNPARFNLVDTRPETVKVDPRSYISRGNTPFEKGLILHETVGDFNSSLYTLSKGGGVSAHLLIGVNGRQVLLTPPRYASRSVGLSVFNKERLGKPLESHPYQYTRSDGRVVKGTTVNHFTYSIEMVTDPKCIGSYTFTQMSTAAKYAVKLGLKPERIQTHKEVSDEGKQDPRGMDLTNKKLKTVYYVSENGKVVPKKLWLPGGLFWYYHQLWATTHKKDAGARICLDIPKDRC